MLHFILLIAIYTTGKTTAESEAKLGCYFVNDDYDYYYEPRSLNEVAFGDIGHVNELYFENEQQYRQFLFYVEQIYFNVIALTITNDFDSIIGFHKVYQQRRSSENFNFNAFYGMYNLGEFHYRMGTVGLIIRIFDNLALVYPEITKASFVATVDRDVLESDYNIFNENFIFVHGHVAGVVMVRIGDKSAYLILDAEKALIPKTVYAHGPEFPFAGNPERHRSIQDTLDFEMMGSFVRSKKRISDRHEQQLEIPLSDLYYVRQPLCSFMNTAVKLGLLKKQLFITSRWQSGFTKDTVSVKVQQRSPPRLLLSSQSDSGTVQTFWYLEYQQFGPSDQTIAEYVLQGLGLSSEAGIDPIMNVYRSDLLSVIQDTEFVSQCQLLRTQLTRRYDQD